MCVLLNNEACRKVFGTGDVDDVRFAFGRLADAAVFERQRIAWKRAGEHAEHQAGKILLHGVEALLRQIYRRSATSAPVPSGRRTITCRRGPAVRCRSPTGTTATARPEHREL